MQPGTYEWAAAHKDHKAMIEHPEWWNAGGYLLPLKHSTLTDDIGFPLLAVLGRARQFYGPPPRQAQALREGVHVRDCLLRQTP